ncbi:MAG TPA: hypothetical protein VLB74_01315 [Flavobacterium sp.]|nr:hypothetical protein [Flavobacterium sp.]
MNYKKIKKPQEYLLLFGNLNIKAVILLPFGGMLLNESLKVSAKLLVFFVLRICEYMTGLFHDPDLGLMLNKSLKVSAKFWSFLFLIKYQASLNFFKNKKSLQQS